MTETTYFPQRHDIERWLTAEDVARYLRYSVLTVYRHARAKRLPHVRVGRAYRFPPLDHPLWAPVLTSRRRNDPSESEPAQQPPAPAPVVPKEDATPPPRPVDSAAQQAALSRALRVAALQCDSQEIVALAAAAGHTWGRAGGPPDMWDVHYYALSQLCDHIERAIRFPMPVGTVYSRWDNPEYPGWSFLVENSVHPDGSQVMYASLFWGVSSGDILSENEGVQYTIQV